MSHEVTHVHYFRLHARTAIRKPMREYHFNDLEQAREFVLRFVQKHAPGRNGEAIWAHISSESELVAGHVVRGNMANIIGGFLLNFGEVGPYPSSLDDDPLDELSIAGRGIPSLSSSDSASIVRSGAEFDRPYNLH